MSNDLSYINNSGNTVFTSKFLQNRGTCCKSACLHCPYGFTLKKHGLQFLEVGDNEVPLIEKMVPESIEWRTYFPENIRLLHLKDQLCGVMLKNHIVVKHLFLRPEFSNQGLSREMVESYFFI